jgi:hypothetical protein
MPRGASPGREREYRELEHKFEEEDGRYKRKSPDRNLPISDYQHLTAGKIRAKLDACPPRS